jgi:hypothetical protein
MARIRIVDEWLRSPASPPTHYRTVMVVAEKWAEQRVLMRAYAECRDQIRPTIVLHGQELAIGPASNDPNGPWGIHVQPPSDGRAQELQAQLEVAARRLSGSKGNPPRLEDEESTFERKPTNNWAPGTPPDVQRAAAQQPTQIAPAPPGLPGMPAPPAQAHAHPAPHAYPAYSPPYAHPAAASMPQPPAQPPVSRMPAVDAATYIPNLPMAEVVQPGAMAAPGMVVAAPVNPALRKTPVPMPAERARPRSATTPPTKGTALGYQSGAGAQSAVVRLGLNPGVSQRLARLSNRTLPADFQITKQEREALNAIGEQEVVAARVLGQRLGIADPVGWMEQLVAKLERFGLDIVEPGPPQGGEPTYVLRR